MPTSETQKEIDNYRKLEKLLKPLLDEKELKRVLAEFEPDPSESEQAEIMRMGEDAAFASPAVRSVNRYQRAVQKCSRVLDATAMALDSAEAVYGAALRRMGHDTRGILPSSYETIFDNLARAGVPASARLSARDRAHIEAKHPNIAAALSRIKQV